MERRLGNRRPILAGTEVNSGGALNLSAEKVTLSSGFSVKAGGTLSVRAN